MSAHNKVTLNAIASSIYPDWDLQEWFKWPPDLFALFSLVMQRTGCYKTCLMNCSEWAMVDWQKKVEKDANTWLEYVNLLIREPGEQVNMKRFGLITPYYKTLQKHWGKMDIDNLRILRDTSDNPVHNDDVKEFAIAMIVLFVVADSCCRGVGLVGSCPSKRKKLELFHGVANLLLNNTGSLSTIPKFFGIVLPKMRTPQTGLALRSLSHHLTFHATEVEVMWRTFPWLNNHKQSLNILAVPYPKVMNEVDLQPVVDNYHVVRYFKAKVKAEVDKKFIQELVHEVCRRAEENREIDIIVFPEMSLNENEYNFLLNSFYKNYSTSKSNYHQLPIIIAGVIRHTTESDDKESSPINNEVRMAIFFAGRWYGIVQRKHHRWLLDRNQILQYKLEGRFPTDRNWFEFCTMSQRRLNILAPNAWLALTSLICEDLARQEPVGEIIRGVGPTLLLALLSDGPQLKNRWSARYVSVLADDPGTAVLSLTSEGMVLRSQKHDAAPDPELNNGCTVGLWKDMLRGWAELNLSDKSDGIIFTISAKFREEFTLDGRTDHTNASVFQMDTIRCEQVRFREVQGMQPNEDSLVNNDYIGKWNDIRELSAVLFSIDSIISLLCEYDKNGDNKDVDTSISMLLNLLTGNKDIDRSRKDFFVEIKEDISNSWTSPESVGIGARKRTRISDQLNECIAEITQLVGNIKKCPTNSDLAVYYRCVVKVCEQRLEAVINKRKSRISKLTATAFLYTIYSRLSDWKSHRAQHASHGITTSDAIAIRQDIEKIFTKTLRKLKVDKKEAGVA